MKGNVEPASDSIVRGVLPSLKTVAMAEIVGRLPVVEGLITILDRSECGGDEVCD